MKAANPRKSKARYSDPSTPGLTPLRKRFTEMANSSRAQSLSPKKREGRQPLHIRMSLTETQMDKVTEAFTAKVVNSPTRPTQSSNNTATGSGHKARASASSKKHHRNKYSVSSNVSDSTTFSDLMPRAKYAGPSTNNLADRRHRATPAPIRTESQYRPAVSGPYPTQLEVVSDVVSPLSPLQMYEAGRLHDDPNFYCSPGAHPLPLKVNSKGMDPFNGGQYSTNNAIFDEYNEWARHQSPVASPHRAGPRVSPQYNDDVVQYFKEAGQGIREAASHSQNYESLAPSQMVESPPFSPFPFYFHSDFPQEKKGTKTLISDKGWLERTDAAEEKIKKVGSSKKGILDGIKKIAKDMTELHSASRRSQNTTSKESVTRPIAVSLDAREQGLLYGELEYHLTNALNTFITIQLEKGRLSTDKLKRISDGWLAQGRPRVVGFRYDLETQLDLVQAHIEDFVFFGRRQGNPVEISGVLHSMRVNARAMRIRTYCQPDSVTAKQIVDAQSLFNMIGVARTSDVALAEIAQFFKVCVERQREEEAREQEKSRKSMFVCEKQGHQDGGGGGGRRMESTMMQPEDTRGGNSDDDWRYTGM